MYDGKKNVLALEIAGEIPQQRGILRPSAETAASLYLPTQSGVCRRGVYNSQPGP